MSPTTTPREATITATLTREERDALGALAEREALSISTFVRRLVRSAIADRSPMTASPR